MTAFVDATVVTGSTVTPHQTVVIDGERIVAVAQDERSQSRNRELALKRLAERLARALAVPRKRRPTRPTAASRERRLAAKRRGTERKRERRPPEDV